VGFVCAHDGMVASQEISLFVVRYFLFTTESPSAAVGRNQILPTKHTKKRETFNSLPASLENTEGTEESKKKITSLRSG